MEQTQYDGGLDGRGKLDHLHVLTSTSQRRQNHLLVYSRTVDPADGTDCPIVGTKQPQSSTF